MVFSICVVFVTNIYMKRVAATILIIFLIITGFMLLLMAIL